MSTACDTRYSIDVNIDDENVLTSVPRHVPLKFDAVLVCVPAAAPYKSNDAPSAAPPSPNKQQTQQSYEADEEQRQFTIASLEAAHESAEVAVAQESESEGSAPKRPVVPPIEMCDAPPSPAVAGGGVADMPNATSRDASTTEVLASPPQTPVRRSWLAPSLTPAATTPGTPSDFGWFVSISPGPATPAQQRMQKSDACLTDGEEETPKGVLQRACQQALARTRFM